MGSTSETDSAAQTRIRQQEVVAELGQQSLETDDLDQLMHDAAVAVAETLDNEYAKVLELLPDGDEVLLRQGVGWRDGLVGSATAPTDRDSQAGYTLQTEKPVIVEDLCMEDRFSGPELLTSHDVVSGISVIIGSVENPWGVLGTHSTEYHEFTQYDATFVQNVANVLASSIENHQTRQSLHEEKEQFRRLVEEVEDYAIFMLDRDGYVHTWNKGAENIKGYDKSEIVGEHFSTFYPHEDVEDGLPERLLAEAKTEGRTDHEGWRVRADGSRFWASVSITALYDETGELRGFTKVTKDLTERRARERQLRESEQRYRTLAECFPNGIVTLYDDNLRYTLADGRAFDDLAVSPEDVKGRQPSDVWGSDVGEMLESAMEAALDGEERTIETGYAGGEWIVHVVPVTSDEGDVFAGMTMAQDITERKKYEAELERTLDLLEKTEHIADVGGWEIDPDTEEVFWTDHIFELLGIDSGEEPSLDEALAMYDEQDQSIVEEALTEALESGEPFDIEARIRTHGDETRWLRLQGVPETDDGEVVSLRGAAHDITEHKVRERRLEEVIEELETSNERLEQFAYAASHDLQEPLRMVSSYLQLIEQRYSDNLDEDAEEFIDFAVEGADRMRAMIEGLLEYSRVETRGNSFEPVDLNTVLADVRDNLQMKIQESDAELAVEDLPRVRGDANQLRQLFQNLLENAIQYSGDDPPQVHVGVERDAAKWVISVEDEGIGIDPDQTENIFQVFKRLHSNVDHSGTGIGLALCERIVERHGGEIWVDSGPGEGATFSVRLPPVNAYGT